MIWEYSATVSLKELLGPTHQQLVRAGLPFCAFCKTGMSSLYESSTPQERSDGDTQRNLTLYACAACGWWNMQHTSHRYSSSAKRVPMAHDETDVPSWDSDIAYFLHEEFNVACGSLKLLDVTDISIPMSELEAYITARYSERYRLPPRRFEEMVAGIFADFGYRPRLTSFSGDRGVDVVIFDGAGNDIIGIEVKRQGGKVGVEQIRSFAGALLLNRLPRGIYVTTSSYTRGARETRDRYLSLGMPIELVDSQLLYDCLRLKHRSMYSDPFDANAPWHALLMDPQKIPDYSSMTDLY